MLLGHHREGGAPFGGTPRVSQLCAAAAVVMLLAAGLTRVGAGIIELGRKGQTATGSQFVVKVDGKRFGDPNQPHSAGDSAQLILKRICAAINADPQYTASPVANASDLGCACPLDPNLATCFVDAPADPNRNAIRVLRESNGAEVSDISVSEDDSTIVGAGVEVSRRSVTGAAFRWDGVDAVDPNASGTITLNITLANGTPPINVAVNSPWTSASQVNTDMKAALENNKFIVNGSGPYTVVKPGERITKVLFTHSANAGVNVSSAAIGLGGPPDAIPTLSQWGMIVLVALMGLAAFLVMRRRRPATAS